ncbi:MAG: hypothetical protein K8S87_01905 [Planctomycetes bacterium]|nr:hypothetical protein [Planctomycetota bacterium]
MFNFGIKDKKVHFKLTGDNKRSSSGKGAFKLNFMRENKAKSNQREVDSPLFGKMVVPDQRKFLGMSKKMQFRFYLLIIAIIGAALLVGNNLLATFAEINESRREGSDTSEFDALRGLYTEREGDSSLSPNFGIVEEDASDNPDFQLPSSDPLVSVDESDIETLSNDTTEEKPSPKPDSATEKNTESDAKNDDPLEKFEIDDKDVPRDEHGLKPQVTLPVGVYDKVDYNADENPAFHAELLGKMNLLDALQVKKLANPYKQIKAEGEKIDTWYKTYKNSSKLKDYTGRIFEIEATIFKLEKKPCEYFNIKSSDINGQTHIWQGILAFRYLVSYPVGNKLDEKLQDELGFVSFTALKLPDWITPGRVYDEKALPLRVKCAGAFYGVPYVDPNVLEGVKQDSISMPHIVLGVTEQVDSLKPVIDNELINRIFDGNSYTMQKVPIIALLNLLYSIKFMPEEKIEELIKNYDPSIGYFDLLNNPPVFRKVSPVVRFIGELGPIVRETQPMKRFVNIRPNPYNIRSFKLGALRITKYDKPRNVIFDTLNVEIINPHTGKYVSEGTSICPETGKKIDKAYLTAGDSVEIYGYMLFNWRYLSQDGDFITNPRIVALKVRQIVSTPENVSSIKWIFLAIVIIVIVIVIILMKKERKNATEFRKQFFRSHMQKAGLTKAGVAKTGVNADAIPDENTVDSSTEDKKNENTDAESEK